MRSALAGRVLMCKSLVLELALDWILWSLIYRYSYLLIVVSCELRLITMMTTHCQNTEIYIREHLDHDRFAELLRRLDRVEGLLSKLVEERAVAAIDRRQKGARLRYVAGKVGNVVMRRVAREIMSSDAGRVGQAWCRIVKNAE